VDSCGDPWESSDTSNAPEVTIAHKASEPIASNNCHVSLIIEFAVNGRPSS
jgi:hypothetical protein